MEAAPQLTGRGQELMQGTQKPGKYNAGFGTKTSQSFRLLWFWFFPYNSFFFFLYLSLCYPNTSKPDIYHPRKLLTTNCDLQEFFSPFTFLLCQRQQLTLTSCFTTRTMSSCFMSCCQHLTNYPNSHVYTPCNVQCTHHVLTLQVQNVTPGIFNAI